ncbi:uncharacterized protein A1O9_13052, partial [Exophiala aquamarina CBS 119918]
MDETLSQASTLSVLEEDGKANQSQQQSFPWKTFKKWTKDVLDLRGSWNCCDPSLDDVDDKNGGQHTRRTAAPTQVSISPSLPRSVSLGNRGPLVSRPLQSSGQINVAALQDNGKESQRNEASAPAANDIPPDQEVRMFLQPETRSISQEQLVNEVKGIYAGLVMVEKKCMEICQSQSQTTNKLSNEQWQALIALHRTLLHEHHDFFLASQHPT